MYIIVVAWIIFFIFGITRVFWIFVTGKSLRELIDKQTLGSNGKPYNNIIDGQEVLYQLDKPKRQTQKIKRKK